MGGSATARDLVKSWSRSWDAIRVKVGDCTLNRKRKEKEKKKQEGPRLSGETETGLGVVRIARGAEFG